MICLVVCWGAPSGFYSWAGKILQRRPFPFSSLEAKDLPGSSLGAYWEKRRRIGMRWQEQEFAVVSIQCLWFPCPQLSSVSSSLATLLYPLQRVSLQSVKQSRAFRDSPLPQTAHTQSLVPLPLVSRYQVLLPET